LPFRHRNSSYAVIGLIALGLILVLVRFINRPRAPDWMEDRETPGVGSPAIASQPEPVAPGSTLASAGGTTRADALDLLEQRLDQADARESEALLTFRDDEAYREFLERAAAAGLMVLGQIDALRTVRIGYDSLDPLLDDLLAHTSDYEEIAANYLLWPPPTPLPEDRALIYEVPFGDRLLEFLGATGDRSTWGRSLLIAILDTGISADPTFGIGRIQSLDIGLGLAPGAGANDGHGTAVAALAAGASSDAAGIAPAASLLSIRVTDANGLSDIFTISQALLAAINAGADIVNISLGGYGTSGLLTAAISRAVDAGVVIVASAGNDQAAQLTWPAADARVISVGAVDALGQQVLFSNAGDQLHLTAPGYGVPTAWLDGQRITMDGTSASAPLVSGAIAAILSANPLLSATDAVQVLETYASDSGIAGPDPDYGSGVLNLGWALNRNNPGYVDTAVASTSYDPVTRSVGILVQNRGNQSLNGLTLDVAFNGQPASRSLGMLAAGAATVVRLPVGTLDSDELTITANLQNPPGVTDAVPSNNRSRASVSLTVGP